MDKTKFSKVMNEAALIRHNEARHALARHYGTPRYDAVMQQINQQYSDTLENALREEMGAAPLAS